MIKKKTNRIENLAVEYIRSNTIDICDFFNIFKPYVVFVRNSGDSNPTRLISKFDASHDDYNNLLGRLTFVMNKGDVKKYNIRSFNVYQGHQWSVWAYGYYNDEGEYQKSNIFFTTSFTNRIYNNLNMYHFLREMKKVVPNCLIEIEKLLFAGV